MAKMDKNMIAVLAESSKNYISQLGSFDCAELSAREQEMALAHAIACHESWMRSKMAKGYVYGEVCNNNAELGQLTDSELVPFEQLSEETKQKNIMNAQGIFNILKAKGFGFMSKRDLCRAIARQIHDNWVMIQVQNGFVWGPETDKANKIHRDLLDFDTLEMMYPEDVSYDMETAEGLLNSMWEAGFVLVGFMG